MASGIVYLFLKKKQFFAPMEVKIEVARKQPWYGTPRAGPEDEKRGHYQPFVFREAIPDDAFGEKFGEINERLFTEKIKPHVSDPRQRFFLLKLWQLTEPELQKYIEAAYLERKSDGTAELRINLTGWANFLGNKNDTTLTIGAPTFDAALNLVKQLFHALRSKDPDPEKAALRVARLGQRLYNHCVQPQYASR